MTVGIVGAGQLGRMLALAGYPLGLDFLFLDRQPDWQPAPELGEFLASGPPPVYIGFGSMVEKRAAALTSDAIAAIRSTGSQQIIVVEPGKAGGRAASEKGWATFDLAMITDPNILYSRHIYHQIIAGNPTLWDRAWGPLLNTRPIYYGEWAVLPHPDKINHCTGLTSANADALTKAFLAYLDQKHANWTAWDFRPSHLPRGILSGTRRPRFSSKLHRWPAGTYDQRH